MDHEKWPKTEPDELIAYLRRKFKQCDCPGCEECKSYENAANLIESSLLKLDEQSERIQGTRDAYEGAMERALAAESRLGAIRTAFDRWDGGQGDQWELLNELERILKGGAVEPYFRTAAAAMESNEPSDGLPITATLVETQPDVCGKTLLTCKECGSRDVMTERCVLGKDHEGPCVALGRAAFVVEMPERISDEDLDTKVFVLPDAVERQEQKCGAVMPAYDGTLTCEREAGHQDKPPDQNMHWCGAYAWPAE